MAKKAARALNVTLNSVAIEDELNQFQLQVTQENPVVTAFADDGPRVVPANYDWNMSGGGSSDFAASQGDATLFGMLGSAGVTIGADPTGASAATNDPNYDGTVVLSNYQLSFQNGQAAQYSFQLQGTSALARATS